MQRKVKFGVIADTHPDIVPGGVERMEKFLAACRKENVDFIIELGDFGCRPSKENDRKIYYDKDKILSLFKNFEKPSYHVIGNHDCDNNTKKADLLAHYGAPYAPYYSFDMGGFHFVVLDNNNYLLDGIEYSHDSGYMPNSPSGNKKLFPYLPQAQLAWLKEDLEKAENPAILFAHYELLELSVHGRAPELQKNHDDFLDILMHAPSGVKMCVSGHRHVDKIFRIHHIWQYMINSMSNIWIGSKFPCLNEEHPELDEQFPMLRYVCPYKDAVYAIIEMDESGARVQGVQSEFVGKTPDERGLYTYDGDGHAWMHDRIPMEPTPAIRSRYIPFIKMGN